MPADWALDLSIAPEGALARIADGLNRRPKRMFGILKTEDEFVGAVRDGRFEIWERRKQAVHAVGSVQARPGGTRIELRFILPIRTRVLLALFFVLYILVALGIALRPPDTVLSVEELLIAALGAAVVGGVFLAGARTQQAALRAFIEGRLADLPRL